MDDRGLVLVRHRKVHQAPSAEASLSRIVAGIGRPSIESEVNLEPPFASPLSRFSTASFGPFGLTLPEIRRVLREKVHRWLVFVVVEANRKQSLFLLGDKEETEGEALGALKKTRVSLQEIRGRETPVFSSEKVIQSKQNPNAIGYRC